MNDNLNHELCSPMGDICLICGAPTEQLLDLPNLPLTDTYSFGTGTNLVDAIDQECRYCSECGHAQLAQNIHPEVLYGNDYYFRSSESETGRKGIEFFLSFIDELAPNRKFKAALDLGCNDLHLLEQLKSRAEIRIGIDPIWKGKEDGRKDKSIHLFGDNIEDVDISQKIDCKPDLIVCRHTLEHIANPIKVLNTLLEIAAPDALFVFEVPGFEALISRLRFDQIFHQHLQYFSLPSFQKMLQLTDCEFIESKNNFHQWGAVLIGFRKSHGGGISLEKPKYTMTEIKERHNLFKTQLLTTKNTLESLSSVPIYGYGAAQMLPVLAYHMETDLSILKAILDDDPNKDGVGYWNLPVTICASSKVKNLQDTAILITAFDNVYPIMKRLLSVQPKHVLVPLSIF